ncbi:C-Myc-binding protein, putative [Plasmodium sp. DRC-Itaito]|uniref:c-Myc-binding protein, putative n=1 Tax=Plasmodium gaboni TaxID=647221 RepID=A0ABY1UKB1_9APIC|nr:C-Myc-binding protein, putative [Plasmodium gaboni]SOV21937.1 C-Myc-binding protein, putative [Plasmodium sp. DRC-Itaito]
MNSQHTENNEKDNFIIYLEEHNVINTISNILLKLYDQKERPPNAIQFIRDNMCSEDDLPMKELKEENEFLRNENMRLTNSLNELNDTLKKLIEEEKMIASTNVESTQI